MDVLEFSGRYDFLSNFYPSVLKYDNKTYQTVEHAYQAAKTLDPDERYWIQLAAGPGIAKKRGQKVTIRKDWENVKIQVMDALVWQKFTNKSLRLKLLAIDGRIVEGNYWGDTFWGVCKGKGRNELGKILMNIRDEIKASL